jgi:hypothetical protein
MVEGRPVWGFPIVVSPGSRRTVHFHLNEPGPAAVPTVPVQPLVLPQQVSTAVEACR